MRPISAAPGSPGINARWTSSAKSGVGTALTAMSQIWFTMSHGILNEIYYRRPDQACTRDLGLIVTDGDGFFSEEKRHAEHRTRCMAHGVPAYETVNVHPERYRITKCVIADPYRDVLLQRIVFEPLDGQHGHYRVFALLAPHLVNAGAGNTAWLGAYKGVPMLFAQGRGTALALACTVPWRNASAGFVGHSDGWQILSQHGKLEPCWTRAEDGNVALTGEIDFSHSHEVTLALGFGVSPEEAAQRVRSSLNYGFENASRDFIAGWRHVLDNVHPLTLPPADDAPDLYRTSVAVMLSHEPYRFAGGIIASLSIPWGFAKGDDDLGGYHLVWPRDLVETAGGLIAAGQRLPARVVVAYLAAVQEADGHWPQNMWLDGTPYWGGVQTRRMRVPDSAARSAAARERCSMPPMRTASPRWSPRLRGSSCATVRSPGRTAGKKMPAIRRSRLAVTVSALLAAANFLEPRGFPQRTIRHLRETADWINDSIEHWTYARGTKLAGDSGVDGYYVRIATG